MKKKPQRPRMIEDAQIAAMVHAAFEYAGIALGVGVYRRNRRRSGLAAITTPSAFFLLAGLLLGAAIGNKAVFFIDRPDVLRDLLNGQPGWPGQSIVGGLIGGLIGIELAKALTGQRQSTGDVMVWPIALGLSVGRVGCLLAGLQDDTYGLPTSLPWGVDLGDGIARHPTQLYEIAFVLAVASLLHSFRGSLDWVPGLRFKLFLSAYLSWRLAIDGLKPVFFGYAGGVSGIQWV
jgi:phosphatidylglycerol:prolipoprotein diacylglycerol transferase